MIRFQNLYFSYGEGNKSNKNNIKNINLQIKQGESVLLCGRSGAGKSTLLRLMNGLAPEFYEGDLEGDIFVFDKEPYRISSEEKVKLFGVVFQDPRSQFFMKKVKDEIAFASENIGLNPDIIMKNIEDISKLLQIEDLLDRNVDELSSGQKQRVAIAAAISLKPKILILDEPISNLDKEGIDAVIQILNNIKEMGTTIVISEHRIKEFSSIVDRYIHISEGMISHIWTKKEFLNISNSKMKEYGFRYPNMRIEKSNAMRKNSDIILSVENLEYSYRRTKKGVHQISVDIPKGSIVAISGDNGAGKTTLCKILCGLISQRHGEISFDKKRLSSRQRREISYFVMQDADYQLYSDSVGNELLLGKKITEKLKEKACESLKMFKLEDYIDSHPASLSSGEKQRVIITAAYCSDAEIYVFDEPTSGMDGEGLLSISRWFQMLADSGKIVIVITHDELLKSMICDFEIKMRDGKIIGINNIL
ncbi:MAG: ABC transporter ATP-binding protein [Tissierellia bacterium]|nr:ABC transporter ATP-binding protein [Tissierellia bacterium]